MSQKALAEKIGVAEPTLAAYEYGRKTPGIDKLKAIAEVLEVPVAELLGADGGGDLEDRLGDFEFDMRLKQAIFLGLQVAVAPGVITVSLERGREKISTALRPSDFVLKIETLVDYALTLPRVRKAAVDAFFDTGETD